MSASDDPESVVRAILAMNLGKAIRNCDSATMRAVLTDVTRHVCRMLTAGASGVAGGYGPARRQTWEVCMIGDSFRAAFELQCAVGQAVAGDYLRVLGFDPRLAVSDPGYHASVVAPALLRAS